ncbi:hypothetical protein Y032_0010g1109 [Ancylostoma ceylanicum]|uniref:Uncharacterized protein n=1 Tax=Ancylostoma ceylanicum TaxID=53326 RepID=A0A016VGC2_9BILA|nr:hypothetical protein Y032_0010g1109 [Ancylostoma ceylanicum]
MLRWSRIRGASLVTGSINADQFILFFPRTTPLHNPPAHHGRKNLPPKWDRHPAYQMVEAERAKRSLRP